MQITIFGASGKVGSLVVAEALKRGYNVTAFIHSKSPFDPNPNFQVIQGNVYSSVEVAKAVAGSQAIISTLGSWGTPKKDILTRGMRHIIPAMQKNKISRIIALTGAGANAPGDKLTPIDKAMHGLMDIAAGRILRDGEEHIRLLQESTLDWTVLRSPVMNTFGNPQSYKLTTKRPFALATIHRHAVAKAMVDLFESSEYQQQSPFITR